MSRRVLPACSSLCYFCPSLRARSRQPVKRYKKIISEIYQLPPVCPILRCFRIQPSLIIAVFFFLQLGVWSKL